MFSSHYPDYIDPTMPTTTNPYPNDPGPPSP
ncbi:hypothetical protein CEXT_186741, partial [Caerostris extrusa]